jgi:hypothetical protein
MPRPFDPLNPITSGPGSLVGPEGPPGPPGPLPNFPISIQIFSGDAATPEVDPVRFGTIKLDLTSFPPVNTNGFVRQVSFVVNFETTNILAVGTVHLRNVDEDEIVTGSTLLTTSLLNEEQRSILTVGSSPGNLKDDRIYEVAAFRTGGLDADSITITNARLEILYV